MAIAPHLWTIIFGRFLVGLGVGLASFPNLMRLGLHLDSLLVVINERLDVTKTFSNSMHFKSLHLLH
jgi:hypothetical protein